MAEEESPIPFVSDAAEVVTVDGDDDADGAEAKETKTDDAEAAKDAARAQAEARRKRILEKANNRMKQVNGESGEDEEGKKTSRSNAARIRAARQRRYGKKSSAAATASTDSTTPATTSTETKESPAENGAPASASSPDAQPEKVESNSTKEKIEAPIEPSSSGEDATASTAAAAPVPKKKYVGVAKMRRKMALKKKMEEENKDPGASSTADGESATTSSASDAKSAKGKSAPATSVGTAGIPAVKVQTVPIYMHMVVILLLFLAGFDVGVHQFHTEIDVRTQVAVQEYGVPFLQRSPWQPLTPIATRKDSEETLEEKLSLSSPLAGAADSQDEFEEIIDEEYNPPNIDPIFRVDLDELTKGPGLLNQMARGALSIHRLILWLIYYGPVGFFGAILSIPTTFIQSPPALFMVAVFLRQIVGKGLLGAVIPEDLGADSADKNNIEILSMAKNFVKNFFTTTFPTLVTLYDVFVHLKADMYVVLCGVFFGLAWTHLRGDAAACDADAVVGEVFDVGDASEGEL